MPKGGLGGAARTGWLVFAVLIVLVLFEYVLFLVLSSNLLIMLVLNVIDAALIMYFFMHLPRLWRREEKEGRRRWPSPHRFTRKPRGRP